jgi:hypothetical protein
LTPVEPANRYSHFVAHQHIGAFYSTQLAFISQQSSQASIATSNIKKRRSASQQLT